MADLTEIINTDTPAQVIERMYEDNFEPRTWLGLSQIGHKCPRWLWMKHRGMIGARPDGRILRLFELGQVIEEHLISDLREAGFNVHSQQDKAVISWDSVDLSGSIDGIIEGLHESKQPHLLEIKSSSAKRFVNLQKVGYEQWDEEYRLQIHAYMLAKSLKRCLVIVYNKDTSELYTERIRLDKEWVFGKLELVFLSILASEMPAGICSDSACFDAKFCDMRGHCF